MTGLQRKKILLGVSGGIAAYKSAYLVRAFQISGATVRVVMTPEATQFVAPLTFSALTEQPTAIETFDPAAPWAMDHIGLARWADLMVVAPATANILGKFAGGLADDLLSTLWLAWDGPTLLAPAMNPTMWRNPAVAANVETLARRGAMIVGPGSGEAACGDEGVGRMSEPEEIVEAATARMTEQTLSGRRILVTAGPTREWIDPVRFISNPSSGKMGVALADAAARRGAIVTLVAGTIGVAPRAKGVEVVAVESCEQMAEETLSRWQEQDALIFSAAVGDYAPIRAQAQKIKKDSPELTLELTATLDIAKTVGERRAASTDTRRPVLVGFAAETQDIETHARGKMNAKGFDLIVANDVGQAGGVFGKDENRAMLLDRDGGRVDLARMPKTELASVIVERMAGMID